MSPLLPTEDASFPSCSLEEIGRFVVISENIAYEITFKILNSSTNKIMCVSNFRSVNYDESPNLRAYPVTSPEVIKSLRDDAFKVEGSTSATTVEDSSSNSSSSISMPAVDSQDLVERTFLPNKEGGQRLKARIIKAIDDFGGDLSRDLHHERRRNRRNLHSQRIVRSC